MNFRYKRKVLEKFNYNINDLMLYLNEYKWHNPNIEHISDRHIIRLNPNELVSFTNDSRVTILTKDMEIAFHPVDIIEVHEFEDDLYVSYNAMLSDKYTYGRLSLVYMVDSFKYEDQLNNYEPILLDDNIIREIEYFNDNYRSIKKRIKKALII